MKDEEHLSRAESLEDYKKCQVDDLVMNIMLAWKRGLGVTAFNGIVSPAYSVFRCISGDSSRYMHSLLRTDIYVDEFKRRSTGVIESRLRLYPEVFGRVELLLPPKDEQQAIATFLDRETARIDALIEKKQRQIELLKEKRQAIITQAVTKGLDPEVPMKDSGVEWLGEVPEHWASPSIKHVCRIIKDGTHLPPPRVDEGYPLLSVRNIIDGEYVFRDDDSMISMESYRELSKSFRVEEGDVLLAIVGATMGKVAIVGDMRPHHIQRSLCVFRTDESKIYNRFLRFIFDSEGFQKLLWQNVGFSAQPGIYIGSLSRFRIPLPELDEQIAIVGFIESQIPIIKDIERQVSKSIDLLKERRSALITAAVTGQIDVRGEV